MRLEKMSFDKFKTLEKEQMSKVFGGACRTGGHIATIGGVETKFSSDTRNDDGSITGHYDDKARMNLKECGSNIA